MTKRCDGFLFGGIARFGLEHLGYNVIYWSPTLNVVLFSYVVKLGQ
jgi:hypothetical protein